MRAHLAPAVPAPSPGRPATWQDVVWPHRRGHEIQRFGTVRRVALGLDDQSIRADISARLNRVLADSLLLYALYKKHHWQVHGPSFPQLHTLMEAHSGQQMAVIDRLAERIQALGGVAVGDLRHVAELTGVPRGPDGVEPVPAMLSRLLEVHGIVLNEARTAARRLAEHGDMRSHGLLVAVMAVGERQGQVLSERLDDIGRAGSEEKP